MSAALEAYRELERRIRTTDEDALRARWEFGRRLLAEREANGGNKLPDGRLKTAPARKTAWAIPERVA